MTRWESLCWHISIMGAALVAMACPGIGAGWVSAAPPTPLTDLPVRAASGVGDARVPVIVTLRRQVPAGAHPRGRASLVRALRAVARGSLPVGLVGTKFRRLWIINAVAVRLRPDEISRLRRDPAVERVEPDGHVRLIDAAPAGERAAVPFVGGGWGLAATFAPEVWQRYGLDGSGVTVGSIDSGVDPAHPDLHGKVAGWRDFVNARPTPYDDHGHGTHTIGTIIGGRPGGPAIGVAPGARIIVAKALDRYGGATASTLLEAAQWMTDPDGDPGTNDAPRVVNASWGGAGVDPDGALRRVIVRWRQLGIVPVFSAGNDGPSRGTVVVPASYPESLAVAATDPEGRITGFSSRGLRRDPGFLGAIPPAEAKPNLLAPGDGILSARVGGGYVTQSGTSMASPHVAGVIALLGQAAPGLPVPAIESLLRDTATDIGRDGSDEPAGAGLVNAIAAVRKLSGPEPARPGLRMIATPPAVTNQAAPAFALATGGARVGVLVDGRLMPGLARGPIIRVPIHEPGAHMVEFAAVDRFGRSAGPRVRRALRIDRRAPSLRFVVVRDGLLGVRYRIEGLDADALDGTLRVLTSDNSRLTGTTGHHRFTACGPYWIETSVSDRAGNVRRVRRVLDWPEPLIARRVLWNRTFGVLNVGAWLARLHRRPDGSFRRAPRLARLIAGNLEVAHATALPAPSALPAPGMIGVWSQGRTLILTANQGGRRYTLTDRGGAILRRSRLIRPGSDATVPAMPCASPAA